MIGFHGTMKRKRAAGGPLLAGRKFCDCQSGSALVEFALAASIVFALFFGVIQFAYALYSYQFVNEVARDLTRYAIVRGSACAFNMPGCNFTDTGATLQAYAQSTYNYPGMRMNQVTVTNQWYSPVLNTSSEVTDWSACAGTCNAPGNMIKVTVQYPFTLGIPFVPSMTLNVHSSSSMVISQ